MSLFLECNKHTYSANIMQLIGLFVCTRSSLARTSAKLANASLMCQTHKLNVFAFGFQMGIKPQKTRWQFWIVELVSNPRTHDWKTQVISTGPLCSWLYPYVPGCTHVYQCLEVMLWVLWNKYMWTITWCMFMSQ